MELDRAHLELLATLADSATLSEAAARLHLSGSAASRRLSEAERRIGVSLTRVEGRRVVLTAAGAFLAAEAAQLTDRLAVAEQATRWLDVAERPEVRLGLGFHHQVGTLLADDRPLPAIRRIGSTERLQPLRARTVDLVLDVESAVERSAPPAAGLVRHELIDDHLVAVVPPDHDLARHGAAGIGVDDLAGEIYLASNPRPRDGFEFDEFFRPSAAAPSRIHEVDSISILLDLVAAGVGVSIQPSLAVELRGRPDLARAALGSTVVVTWVAYGRTDPDPPTIELVDRLRSRLTALATKPRSHRGSEPLDTAGSAARSQRP